MRINHNLPASNTYRQLTINNNASAKSMEKLSSGLRINRAGDDAAGLAISEKMRAQIRGLDQATRNSQDGISLIQTAEGALQETHNILQRMRELATQAANDTNVDVDRQEIQKEMNQLTSEINRIGNTTEFNTRQILNGDVAIVGDGKTVDKFNAGGGLRGAQVDAKASIANGNYSLEVVAENKNASIGQSSSNIPSASLNAGDSTKLAGGMYTIDVKHESATVVDKSVAITDASNLLNDANNTQAITVSATGATGAKTITVTKEQVNSLVSDSGLAMKADASTTDKMASGTYTVETKRVFADAATDITATGATKNALTENVISNFQVSDSATATQVNTLNAGANITMAIAANGTAGEVKIDFTLNGETVSILTSDANNGAQNVSVGGVSFDIDVAKVLEGVTGLGGAAAANVTGSQYNNTTLAIGANAIHDQVTVTKGGQQETQSVVSSTTGTATLTFATVGGGFKMDVTGADFKAGKTELLNVDSEYTITDGTDSKTIKGNDIHSNADVSNIKMGDAFVSLDADALSKAAVDTHTIGFTAKTDNAYTAQVVDVNGNAVAGSGKFALDATLGAGATINLGNDVTMKFKGSDLAEGKLSFAVNEEESDYDVVMTKGGVEVGKATVKAGENATFENGVTLQTNEDLSTGNTANFSVKNDLIDNSLSLQIGANSGQSLSIDISDMRSSALNIAGKANTEQTVTDKGKEYTAKFTTINTVTDGTTNSTEEAALDVSTFENATAAIKVVNNAIEKVSAQRSQLGAFQNRLEHTIGNLGSASENLTAAESRVRDVDMAKEIMESTRARTLAQAAQAMLAQANQQPQSIVQILQ